MRDFSKLQDVVWDAFGRLDEKLGTEKAWKVWDENLKSLGIHATFANLKNEQGFYCMAQRIVEFAQQNSDCVLVHAGSEDSGNNIYAIPRPLAEKILVLGGLPGLP